MNKNKDIINYFLTLGFIVLIIIFLSSIIIISRFVLSEDNSIGKYVINTQNLLEDIEEV